MLQHREEHAADEAVELRLVRPFFSEAEAIAGSSAETRGGVEAPVWEGIIDAANEIGAAAIVLGSRGLDVGREALEGSVSHDVARHATCPVLIVPSHGERSHAAP